MDKCWQNKPRSALDLFKQLGPSSYRTVWKRAHSGDWLTDRLEWTNEWTNEQTTNPLYCCWRSQLRLHSQMVNDTLESVTSSGCTVTSYYMVCSYAFCCCWFVIRPVLLLQYYELDESTIIYIIMWKVNWSTWHERGTKKKSKSPTGIERMTSQTHGGRSVRSELRELIKSKVI